jgi:hypothetical protein
MQPFGQPIVKPGTPGTPGAPRGPGSPPAPTAPASPLRLTTKSEISMITVAPNTTVPPPRPLRPGQSPGNDRSKAMIWPLRASKTSAFRTRSRPPVTIFPPFKISNRLTEIVSGCTEMPVSLPRLMSHHQLRAQEEFEGQSLYLIDLACCSSCVPPEANQSTKSFHPNRHESPTECPRKRSK